MTQQLVIDFTTARAKRDAGMQRAADHAERVTDGWQDAALAHLRSFAATHDRFLIEDVVVASKGIVPTAPDSRAWGAVVLRAARERIIEKCGYAPARTSNCSIKPIWRAR